MSFEFQNGAAAQLAQAQLQKDGYLTSGKVVVTHQYSASNPSGSAPSNTASPKTEKWTVEAGRRERYEEKELESLAKYCQDLAARVGSLCRFRATSTAGKVAG